VVFIKGAWIDLRPWDDDYTKYYCCPEYNLICSIRENPLGVSPHWQKEFRCHLAGDMYIADVTDGPVGGTCLIPEWCPLKIRGEIMSLMSRLFPNRVWGDGHYAYSYKNYLDLPESAQKKLKAILGVKRFTLGVSPFCYWQEREGRYSYSLGFSVPGDFGSFPPFDYDDQRHPGLAKNLHRAYEEGPDEIGESMFCVRSSYGM